MYEGEEGGSKVLVREGEGVGVLAVVAVGECVEEGVVAGVDCRGSVAVVVVVVVSLTTAMSLLLLLFLSLLVLSIMLF